MVRSRFTYFEWIQTRGTLTEVSGSPFPADPQVPQLGCVAAVVNGS